MNINVSLKYLIKNEMKAIIIYYFIILCIICLFAASAAIPGNNGTFDISGMEMATIIFLFVVGLNSFKEDFHMFLQNGLSRKTLFFGEVISLLAISGGMAAIDMVIILLGKLASANDKMMQVESLFEMTYSRNMADNPVNCIENLIFQAGLYFTFAMLGFFITIGYYRMNKAAKTVVSISIPVSCFVIIPMLDTALLNGAIIKRFSNAVCFAFGLKSGNVIFAFIIFALLEVIFGGLSWLMIRKANVKSN